MHMLNGLIIDFKMSLAVSHMCIHTYSPTHPPGDRPTIFCEIIQRIGCDVDENGKKKQQGAGCGGFGKGNFSELFKSIEEFEKTLDKK